MSPSHAITAAALLLFACGETEPLESSCCGETVGLCPPYSYAIARSATVEPAAIMPGDPSPESIATIHVEYDSCGAKAPGNHRIVLQARTTGASLGDAGSTERIIELDVFHDDGESEGDPVAQDGVVEVMVANPFFDLPPSTTVTLRFTPQLGFCSGETHEIEYTTGPMWEPDPGP